MPLISWQSCFAAGAILAGHATAFTGSEYQLTHEYSGTNFFEGWDFFTGRDPTGGFVTYYSQSSSQLTGLIKTSEDGPAYMGVNYVDTLPFDATSGRGNGAGRPSVRIASKQAFTHGLFIGDFEHIPAGVCGTWPAFWTLGPNWPYTGEIDIMEGVNANMNNVMSLHTNETCIIDGNSTTFTGSLENTNCAYYPDYNVGCGIKDERDTSFGIGFNNGGGGVYAMQWTSESINIWYWARADVPDDVDGKDPDPGSWGLPAGQLAVGNCSVDQHFQSHKIIFDTTFCGEYAGNPYVWKTDDTSTSCADLTGLATCDNYVANQPAAFEEAYWSVNYVRVYQLVDPADDSASGPTYIASEQPANAATQAFTAAPAVATPNLDADALCPQYNFSIITDGKYQYEVACGFDPPGPDIQGQPYDGFKATSMADCIKGCSYMNEQSPNKCGGVSHFESINFCYFKKYIDGTPMARPGYNEIRLIYYGYPQITDDPRSTAANTATSVFVETIPSPQTYRPLTTTSFTTLSSVVTSSTMSGPSESATLPPAMGDNSTSTSTVPGDYSETVTEGYGNATSTIGTVTFSDSSSVGPISVTVTNQDTTSAGPITITMSSVVSSGSATGATSSASRTSASTEPEATNNSFLIAFNVADPFRLLKKRAVQYLAFNQNGESILVTNEADAARFYLDEDKNVKTGKTFVAVDTAVSPPRFIQQTEAPAEPVKIAIDVNGDVSVDGVDGYCLTADGALGVVPEGEDTPAGCMSSVEPEVVVAPSATTTTTSASSTSGSMTSMGGGSTTSGLSSAQSTRSSASSSAATGSSSLSTTSNNTDKTTPTAFSSSTTTSSPVSTPTAPLTNDFVYSGCFGVPLSSAQSLPGVTLALTDAAMTNEKCTTACKQLTAYYAGTHDQQCFCGTDVALYDELISYPDGICTTPCPGANREFCGGSAGFQGAVPPEATGSKRNLDLEKRQANAILVSLYNNTLLIPQQGDNNEPTGGGTGAGTSTTSGSTGVGGDTTSTTKTITAGPGGQTGTVTDGGIGFDPNSVSYNVTGTNTATVISTTYVDVCDDCAGGLTTRATTITIPHCGCTASYDAHLQTSVPVSSPAVPMVTTVKDCACGHAGAQSTITVTVPHTSSINELAAMVTQNGAAPAMGVPANAAAMPSASHNVMSSGVAPAFAGPVAPTQGEDEDTVAMGSVAAGSPSPMNAAAVGGAPAPAAGGEGVMTTSTDVVAAGGTRIPASSPAPASPASAVGNTQVDAGLNSSLAAGNSTTPASNGTISAPIDAFKSSANKLLRSGILSSSILTESRYLLGLLVGLLFAGVASTW